MVANKSWNVVERLADDVFEHLLLSRGLDTKDLQQSFFTPSLNNLASPTAFHDMEAAIGRIIAAIKASESMVVWGDFDADGVTSTAILWETIHRLGGKVMPYIPSRETEGHGFSESGLQKASTDGVKLIITVDHGITAIEEAGLIAEMGVDLIVSDHHEPRIKQGVTKELSAAERFDLPQAVAVIHPELMDEPEPLAGCGVAYYLAYGVWLEVKQLKDDESARQSFANEVIELAGIGTIADMVPLQGSNRVFAALGLRSLPDSSRVGLQRMMQLAGLQDKRELGAYDVGFGIGPRLNAPGRLADALESLRLLCTKDERRAGRLAQELDALNKHRQDLLARVTEEAKAEALKHADGVYILAKPNWPAGVCGLAAGKIVERYHRPAVVMEVMGELSRGSARSIKGFDITAALDQISDDLESFGGHAMAAGFVAKTDKLPEIERRLSELLFQQLTEDELKPSVAIDAEVDDEILNWQFYEKLQLLEPCGMGNPRPVFVMRKMRVQDLRTVGSDKKHLKLALQPASADVTNSIEAIGFNLGYWIERVNVGTEVDVVFGLDKNEWNGRKTLQMMVKDLRISEI